MTAAATTSNSTRQTSEGPSPAKQEKIDLRTTGLSAPELKKLAGYIVEDMLPISTVDSEVFRSIAETRYRPKAVIGFNFRGWNLQKE